MKIDGNMLVDDPIDAGPIAKTLEDKGYHGAFTYEGRHDPFFPLVAAAQQTERIELMTAIAIAFARNPMTLANIGYDLQLASKGRFVLGLGTQIKPHIERRFSMTWSKPAARMRELIQAIRAIWACWQDGERLDFRGEHYQHTLMTPVFDPGPNPYGLPKIFAAGVGPLMTEVVGEVADGFFVHPFHTVDFLRTRTISWLEAGLEKSGRPRDAFEIAGQCIIVTGRTDEEFETARNGARAQLGFYGSTPAYRPVLDHMGMGDLQDELNRLSKEGKWLEMAARIDDDVLDALAVVAPRDALAEELRKRYAGVVDRLSLVAHTSPDPDLWADVVEALADA